MAADTRKSGINLDGQSINKKTYRPSSPTPITSRNGTVARTANDPSGSVAGSVGTVTVRMLTRWH